MPNKLLRDTLFVNRKLLDQLIEHIDDDGRLASAVRKKRSRKRLLGELKAKIPFLETRASSERETSQEVQREFRITYINDINGYIYNRRFLDSIPGYGQALELESKNRQPRFVRLVGAVSWQRGANDTSWEGDVVIFSDGTNRKVRAQHVLSFNGGDSLVVPNLGSHCRALSAITFWRDRFQSKNGRLLSEAEVVILWDTGRSDDGN